jgi:hypothetical protein
VVVGQDVDAAVVGLEVVDLLPEEHSPQVFAEELYYIQRCCGTGRCAGEPKLSSLLVVALGSHRV